MDLKLFARQGLKCHDLRQLPCSMATLPHFAYGQQFATRVVTSTSRVSSLTAFKIPGGHIAVPLQIPVDEAAVAQRLNELQAKEADERGPVSAAADGSELSVHHAGDADVSQKVRMP